MRRDRMTFRSFTGLALAILLAALPAAPAAAQQQGFTDITDVVVIEVPVQVLRDGEPVRGLTAADFEVFDGRRKQPIVGFEALDLSAVAPAQAAEIPGASRRHFLMMFDLSFSEPSAVLRARQAAVDVIEALHPSDLVAVSTYSAKTGPQLVLGFTPDRRQAKVALETLGMPKAMDRSPDPLRLVASAILETDNIANTSSSAGGGGRRIGAEASDEVVREQLELINSASRTADRTAQQVAVKTMTRSFGELAKLMGAVDGRKYVVYLSEGYDSSLLTGTGTETMADANKTRDAIQSGNLADVNSDELYGNTQSLNEAERMLEEFRRADCVIQAVDIGGLRGQGEQGRRPNGKDSLLQMAKGTGGELYENFNDLSSAMEKMLQKTSVTYVLAIQPDKLKLDGTFHRLKVELKGQAARGARVVHRPGYYAPKPFKDRSALEKLLDTASQVMAGEEDGSIRTSVLAAPFRFNANLAYVPVLIEAEGASLTAGTQGTSLPAEIYIYAFDRESGTVRDYMTQTLALDLSKVTSTLRQSGLKFFGHLDLPPGSYTVRALVRNGVTGAAGLRVVDVDVPAAGQTAPVLLPPFFPEAPGKWLMAREQPRGPQQNAPYPFLMKEQPYIPSSRPLLVPGQDAAVALVGYNLGAGDLQVQTRVTGPDGAEVPGGEMKITGRETSGGADRLQATFRAPQAAPGEYRLTVTVTGAGGAAQSTAVPFVIGNRG